MERFLLVILLLFALSCATTKTESFVIELPTLKPIKKTVGIQLVQTGNENLGLNEKKDNYLISSIEKKEMVSLNHSLYATLVKNKIFKSVKALKKKNKNIDLQLYWMVRKYLVVASGGSAQGVACVSYCLVNSKQKIVLTEDFSVASECFHCMIGGLKTRLNTAIVNRLVVRLFNINQKKSEPRLALTNEYYGVTYYRSFQEAISILPEVVRNLESVPDKKIDKEFWQKHLNISQTVNWRKVLKNRLCSY